MNDNIKIGRAKWFAWLRKTLTDKMISESKLAHRIGITKAQINHFKAERSYPSRKTLEKINEALGGEIPYFHYREKHTWLIKNDLSE